MIVCKSEANARPFRLRVSEINWGVTALAARSALISEAKYSEPSGDRT